MNRFLYLILWLLTTGAFAQTKPRVALTADEAGKRVDVTIDGQPFTSYIYPGPAVLKKPVLYPIRSAGGHFVTRGWPFDPRPGERVDHPHHVGMWFNYGDVNGYDFWNNSTDAGKEHNGSGPAPRFGTIVHTGIKRMKSGNEHAELTVTADWLDETNAVMLREETTYRFRGGPGERSIDRLTKLTAADKDVLFRDNKEGLIGLRLARSLEHPATKPDVFTDASGVTTAVPVLDNTGVTGHYRSSEGVEGEAVWGKRGTWVSVSGTVEGEPVTLTLMDHPQNVGYPTYWHARGYGLFAANPLAPSVFTNGKEPAMNYTLKAGQSVEFRYRLVIRSGAAGADQSARQAEQFRAGK